MGNASLQGHRSSAEPRDYCCRHGNAAERKVGAGPKQILGVHNPPLGRTPSQLTLDSLSGNTEIQQQVSELWGLTGIAMQPAQEEEVGDPLLEDFKHLRRRIFHWHGETWEPASTMLSWSQHAASFSLMAPLPEQPDLCPIRVLEPEQTGGDVIPGPFEHLDLRSTGLGVQPALNSLHCNPW